MLWIHVFLDLTLYCWVSGHRYFQVSECHHRQGSSQEEKVCFLLDCLTFQDEGTMKVQNAWNPLPDDRGSLSGGLNSQQHCRDNLKPRNLVLSSGM